MTIRYHPFMANYEYVAIHGRSWLCWHQLVLIVRRQCEKVGTPSTPPLACAGKWDTQQGPALPSERVVA
jgi:hypothetical protein